MASRRNHKPRRRSAAATAKPTPAAEANPPAAPVQTQAAEAAAEALIAAARTKADDITNTALDAASAAEQAAEALQDKANGEAERILAEAQLAAERIEKAAEGRTAAVQFGARSEVDEVLSAARRHAERIGETAAAEAQQVVQAAKAETERLMSEAQAAAEQARQTLDRAKADAAWTAEETKGLRARSLASANHEAKQIVEAAHAATEREKKHDDAFDTWSARLVIAGTVGLTASGEYALARMVGFDKPVAWLLPFVIDVYVIQAFRRHRDIVQAIALTVAANVIFHLADKGLFGVEKVARDGNEPKWWLIAMVASVASVILWRMHSITAPPKAEREHAYTMPQPANAPRQEVPATTTKRPTEAPPTPPAKSTTPVDKLDRQEPPAVDDKKRQNPPAKTPTTGAKKQPAKSRQKPVEEKAPRRSMTEWVTLTEPIFHAEFKNLKRNPTASEFADAIKKAGHGRPSDSTAKNIRTEILDRAELPSLDTE